jgi:hypothetical protein
MAATKRYQWQDATAPLKARVAPSKYTPAELKQIKAQKKREQDAKKSGTWNNGYTN